MQFYKLILFWTLSSFISCNSKLIQGDHDGITVFFTTAFYDTTGNLAFTDTLKTWYKDSIAVQELHKIRRTTYDGNSTVDYPVFAYRFMNLRTSKWFDFSSLSDTATILKSGSIPEAGFPDGGWNFYSKGGIPISGGITKLHDTIVDGIKYQLVKFNLAGESAEKSFNIGFVRCGMKSTMFSLEKTFTHQNNCAMTKMLGYSLRNNRPFSKLELEYVADTIPSTIISLCSKWQARTEMSR
jgi:hypothetical protein